MGEKKRGVDEMKQVANCERVALLCHSSAGAPQKSLLFWLLLSLAAKTMGFAAKGVGMTAQAIECNTIYTYHTYIQRKVRTGKGGGGALWNRVEFVKAANF